MVIDKLLEKEADVMCVTRCTLGTRWDGVALLHIKMNWFMIVGTVCLYLYYTELSLLLFEVENNY